MENKIVFGRWEASALLINILSTQIYLTFPTSMIEAGGTAGWLVALYASVIGIVLLSIIIRLYEPFEGKDILDISEIAGGKLLRIIYGTILVLYLVFIISIVLREYSEYMKIVVFNISPISFVALFFAAGMILATYKGLEALARISVFIVVLVMLGLIIITLGVTPYYDFSNLIPLFGDGIYDIVVPGALKVSVFSGLSLLPFLAPFLKTYKNFASTGYTVVLISSVFFIVSVLLVSLVFPYPVGLERNLPIYQVARLINIGRFFQRIESVFVLTWAASALLYLGAGLFFTVYIFKKTLGLDYYKPVILPFAIIMFSIGFLPGSVMAATRLETLYFRNYIWIITFIFPLITILTARARIKAVRKGSKND